MSQEFCKHCESIQDGQSRGDRFLCKRCRKSSNKGIGKETYSLRNGGTLLEQTLVSESPITNIEGLIASGMVDLEIWNIEKADFWASNILKKDKLVTLYTIKVKLSRRTADIRNEVIFKSFLEDARLFAPKYQKIKYKKSKEGNLLELSLPDLQLGRLVAEYETGTDLNPELQSKYAKDVAMRLLSASASFEISRILIPVGNDFFNSNNSLMTTAHGTPQIDDARWHKTFQIGARLMVEIIDTASKIAPVDLVVVPGNHDEERIWYLGEYLEAWYHKNPNVTVNNRPQKRKYYSFGSVLLGLTHGYSEKIQELGSLMAYEVPDLWAKSLFREWHLGDKHHKVDIILKTKELENGVVVRILRSLAPPSVWEFDKGLVGSLKAGESFIWNPKQGLKAQFTESINT